MSRKCTSQVMIAGAIAMWLAGFAVASASAEDLGQKLKVQCDSECAKYMQQAKSGSIRASYEAMACTCACFYRQLPADYPGRDSIKKCAKDNAEEARKLGSNAPVFK